jgi:predicted 3-demethylubiquinone-9 3-methyltransferase (glyoxalase superfamily)
MKKILIYFFLFIACSAQAQVIPVGFIKKKSFTNIPTGTNPVTNNLALYLDATRSESYGGSGTTWNDISGQSPAGPATLAGSPTFSSGSTANGSGSFTFAANKNAKTTKTYTIQQAITFIAWINPSQNTDNNGAGIIMRRWDPSNATGATALYLYNNNKLGYDWTNDKYGLPFSLVVPNLEWSMAAVSINATSATVYLCKSSGISSVTYSTEHGNLVNTAASHFTIGYDGYDPTNRAFKGKIATAMVYYTALTTTEIESIFNAQKASFGL